jgi:medium-chain acyl-[acyl-carrier-protein] hydrolase
MNPIHEMQFTLSHIHVDCFGYAKPSVLLYMMQEAAGEHCKLLNVDKPNLGNLFWAITRTRVQVTRLPQLGETVTLKTWPMPTTRVAYPRSVVAYDAQGSEVFRAISLWVLVDEQTRAMVLPGRSGITVDGTLTGTELAVPHAIAAREMLQTCQKQVTYSLLDQNGHMNNTRYMDWVDDLLPGGFHKDHRVQEFTLCYMNEAREGDEISLQFELADGQILTADAQRQGADRADRIFSAQVIFDGVL